YNVLRTRDSFTVWTQSVLWDRGGAHHFVTTHRHKIFRLRCPTGARLRIAGLEDTMYRDDDYEVKSWGAFYLPDEVKMQVFGVVEGTSCPYDQLVLMTCEDEKVYAYDGEELHVVASSWNKLCEEGIEYPASETYYDGEAFKHMWKSPLGQMFEEEHDKLVAEKKSEFLENLNLARQKRGEYLCLWCREKIALILKKPLLKIE
uniref:Uncharacterized protein n=1 Tax=Monopterus albus TaxID=43700 RepID=A0A3Q3K0N1_MONAL